MASRLQFMVPQTKVMHCSQPLCRYEDLPTCFLFLRWFVRESASHSLRCICVFRLSPTDVIVISYTNIPVSCNYVSCIHDSYTIE